MLGAKQNIKSTHSGPNCFCDEVRCLSCEYYLSSALVCSWAASFCSGVMAALAAFTAAAMGAFFLVIVALYCGEGLSARMIAKRATSSSLDYNSGVLFVAKKKSSQTYC